jgi:hypothetical protein
MISPHNDNVGWSTITLVNRVSPGTVELAGHEREIDWDVQAADGQKGATMALVSRPPGEFDADFYLADQDDFDAWDSFQALIESSVAVDPPIGLDIYHPDLQRNHFTSVVMGRIGGLRLDGKGGGRILVHFKEHLPKTEIETEVASGSKSGGATGGAGGKASGGSASENNNAGSGSPTDPNDPIAAATEELNALLEEGNHL